MPASEMSHCQSTYYWHESGQKDPFIFCAKGNKLYVVTNGTVCGIFSSEARACKQVEGVSNGHWQTVESWEAAIKIWNDNCEVYHKAGCPAPVRPAAPRSVPPAKKTTTREVHHKARMNTAFKAGFRMGKDVSSAAAFEVGFRMGMGASSATVLPPLPPSASASRGALSPHTSPATPRPKNSQPTTTKQLNVGPHVKLPRTSPSTPRPAASPSSPRRLSEMDPVEVFSLMGVANPALQPPLKQWAIGSVNKFFAQQIDALDHILTLHLGQADIMGSRNVKKLRAFIRREECKGTILGYPNETGRRRGEISSPHVKLTLRVASAVSLPHFPFSQPSPVHKSELHEAGQLSPSSIALNFFNWPLGTVERHIRALLPLSPLCLRTVEVMIPADAVISGAFIFAEPRTAEVVEC
ncbi:hypothetical protein B0H14DRAFT_2582130 [Mycena olivaceomarginata]|nr:hypothetical protein B0H14DRAFT_2582130 [Mycena olivaceomarginata]